MDRNRRTKSGQRSRRVVRSTEARRTVKRTTAGRSHVEASREHEDGRLVSQMSRGRHGKKKKVFSSSMKRKLRFVFLLVFFAFIGLMVRIYYIDQNDGERFTKRVLSQQSYVSSAIAYKRGEIVDRNNTVLAKCQKVYNLIISPKDLLEKEEGLEELITLLSSSFDISEEEIQTVLKEKPESQYVVMKKYIDYDTRKKFDQAVEDVLPRGVWFEESYKRVYPLGSTACRVIGFADPGNTANIGIEAYYNDELNGTNGRKYGYYDQNQELQEIVKPAKNGNTVVSTIDANIQQIVEEKLDKFNRDMGAKNVGVILMNPQNGEIYAMACNKPFDLNEPRDLSKIYSKAKLAKMSEEETNDALNEMWRNFCISDAFEPGSTFKPITIGAALEEAIVSDDSTFLCDGGQEVGGRRITCMSHHGVITLSQAVEKSCNDALMQIGAKMDRKRFSKYMNIFCIGKRLGIDIPGEGQGLVFTEEQFNSQELATSSFGQGITTTMLQIAGANCSLINGGYYYQPHLVKEIRNENGAVIKTMEPVLLRQTVSNNTSELIRKYMYNTVEIGTGEKAKIEGYAIGGKTGTAEKMPRGSGKHLVSFLGFVPADRAPELMVYVVVDEPNAAEQDHSYYATDLCHDIMQEVMPFLDIYPSTEVKKEPEAKEEEKAASGEEEQKKPEAANPEGTDLPEEEKQEEGGVKADPFDPADLGREGGFFDEGWEEGSDSTEGQPGEEDGSPDVPVEETSPEESETTLQPEDAMPQENEEPVEGQDLLE